MGRDKEGTKWGRRVDPAAMVHAGSYLLSVKTSPLSSPWTSGIPGRGQIPSRNTTVLDIQLFWWRMSKEIQWQLGSPSGDKYKILLQAVQLSLSLPPSDTAQLFLVQLHRHRGGGG